MVQARRIIPRRRCYSLLRKDHHGRVGLIGYSGKKEKRETADYPTHIFLHELVST